MEYEIRVPSSALKWFENGELVKNPEFSANMEVFRVGINENYNDIQDILVTIASLAPIDSVTGEAQARINADLALGARIDKVIEDMPKDVADLGNSANFINKNYVDNMNLAIQEQITSLSNAIADCLLPANILAGSRVALSKSGKNITISVDVSDIEGQIGTINTNLAKKLEASNIIAGSNITVSKNGNNVTISSTASGGGSSSASGISIDDAGGYFRTNNVEGALQELGIALSGISNAVNYQSGVVS